VLVQWTQRPVSHWPYRPRLKNHMKPKHTAMRLKSLSASQSVISVRSRKHPAFEIDWVYYRDLEHLWTRTKGYLDVATKSFRAPPVILRPSTPWMEKQS